MNSKKEMTVLVITLFVVIGLHSVKQHAISFRGTGINKSLAMLALSPQIQQLGVNNIVPVIEGYPNFTSYNNSKNSYPNFYNAQNSIAPSIIFMKLKGQKKRFFFNMRFITRFRNNKAMRYSPVFSIRERAREVKLFPQPHCIHLASLIAGRNLQSIAD